MGLDDDSDDSSSSSVPETLDQFRAKWQQELSTTKRNKQNESFTRNALVSVQSDNKNDQVKKIAY